MYFLNLLTLRLITAEIDFIDSTNEVGNSVNDLILKPVEFQVTEIQENTECGVKDAFIIYHQNKAETTENSVFLYFKQHSNPLEKTCCHKCFSKMNKMKDIFDNFVEDKLLISLKPDLRDKIVLVTMNGLNYVLTCINNKIYLLNVVKNSEEFYEIQNDAKAIVLYSNLYNKFEVETISADMLIEKSDVENKQPFPAIIYTDLEFSEEYDGTDVKCGNSSDELDSEEIIEEPVEDFFE
jgi:hypothetical protein